jgi:hypothetical protein
MSLRKPFSKLKKKLKRQLAGGGHEPERIGAGTGGENADWTGSLPQPGPHVIAEGEHDHPRPGNETDVDRGRIDPTDPPPHSDDPGFMPVSESGHDGGGREAAIEGREVSQRDLDLRSDVEGVAESGPSQEGEKVDRVHPPKSFPSTSHGGESKSMQTTRHFSRCL